MQFDLTRSITQNLSTLASFCRQPLNAIRGVYAKFGSVQIEHLELAHEQIVHEGRPVKDTLLRGVIDPANSDPRSTHYTGLAQALFPWADFQRVLDDVIEHPGNLGGLSPKDAGTLADLIETFAKNKLSYSPKLDVYEVDKSAGRNLDATISGILNRYEPAKIERLIGNLRAISTSN